MAEGDVLQIVVWSIIFAIALTMVGPKAKPMIEWCESLAETMFKFTNIVMNYAPIGVAAAMAYTVGNGGFGVLYNLAWLVGTLYIALAAFYLLVLFPVMVIFKVPIRKFFTAVKEPAVIAFSTTSSEAALPRAMEAMERLGVPAPHRRVRPAARATASTSTAPRCTCRWRPSSSRRRRACTCRSASRSR